MPTKTRKKDNKSYRQIDLCVHISRCIVLLDFSGSIMKVNNSHFLIGALYTIGQLFNCSSRLNSKKSLRQCQLFKNLEARGKVIDAATTLGRTTGLVLVDCSATYDTVTLLKDAVDHGCCIVLANKKPLTGAYEDFQKLVSNFRRIRFESTVGAGLPVISSVTRIIASGDPIYRIVGSLSDPRDDLGGMDVARKALILARLLGQQISMENINIGVVEDRVTGG
ncbi:unnamed protein product [Miscanthus lutarioriparius]|uniref:homoserine dehydrogenase n=1 Tax=Miscanthus lutarioriparius TaxID=422564 RepID=A0A811QPG3_9POAL|nr:unnamed protein product [Miscanthus lutarioriparius]